MYQPPDLSLISEKYPVYLHLASVRGVYDHASLIVHNVRYEFSPRGVETSPPTSRSCDACYLLGVTPKSKGEALAIARRLGSSAYRAQRYSTLVRNCFDFAEALAAELLGTRGTVKAVRQETKQAAASAAVGGAVASAVLFPPLLPYVAAGVMVSQFFEKVVPRLGAS